MRFAGFAILSLLVLSLPAMGQGVPRIKARLISFDGKTMTVDAGDAKPMLVDLIPTTRIVKTLTRSLADIKTGDYIGATFILSRDGTKRAAQEVHVFPDSLRGSSEGVFAAGGASNRFMIDGTVSATAPGLLTLDYRGADGADGPACTGRAPASGGCHGSLSISVAAGVPVIALVDGDKSMLAPGTLLAISIVAGSDGHPVTPGLTIEGMAPPPKLVPAPATPPRPAGH